MTTSVQPIASTLATNKIIRNTYGLLSMTLLFSAMMAGLAMVLNFPYPGVMVTLLGYFGLLFLTFKLRDSVWGIASVFALTGFMGMTLGPILDAYISHYANGPQLVMTAMGGTGLAFVGLSGYALTTRKDFSFMGGFLAMNILIAFFAGLASIIFTLPLLAVIVSAVFVVLMVGSILYQTSELIHGGETNYILATVGLYVSIYNLFTSLLHLLGVFSGDE